MKKLKKALSLMLALTMVIMSLPTLASADGEAVQTYYPYSEALSFDWGGAGITVHPWNSNVGTLQDAYGTKAITDSDKKKSIKLGMHKKDDTVSGTVNTWNINKEGWRKDPTIYIAGISETGFMHFKIKLEGLESAKDVKVYFRNSGYQQTQSVSIPNGANITSDGNYHDVYIPLSQMIQSTFNVSKDIIEAHFNCLNTETESYVYVREIEFCAPNAVTVKAARSDKETKLTWEKTTKSIGFTPAGYKIFRDGVEIGKTASASVFEYTDTEALDAGTYIYTVVPYTTDGTTETDRTDYSSNGAYVKVISGYVVNKVYDSARTDNDMGITLWNGAYSSNGIGNKCVSASEASFIPQGTYAAKLPMGQDVTVNMFDRVEFPFKEGSKDISSYTGIGKLNMSVYIDTAAGETATVFDRGLKLQVKSYKKGATSEWLDSTSKTVSSLPLNQWTTISVPLGAFGTAYHADSAYSVALMSSKSGFSKADVYIQDINITVDNAIIANAAANTNGVELTWSALSGIFTADGYKILREGVEIADLDSSAVSYTDTTKLAVGRYSYTVVPYTADTILTAYASNKAWADIESEDYKTAYIPPVDYTIQWNDYYVPIFKQNLTSWDKSFIPSGSTATMYPVGKNITTIPRIDFVVNGGNGDFTAYKGNGVLNFWVYIDAPDTELTQYDNYFNIFLNNNNNGGSSNQLSLLPVPLNKWEKISVPLSKFTGNYTYNNIYSVSLNVGKSASIENCAVYVQGLNITAPAITCDEAIVYDADGYETQQEEILYGEEYTVKMTLNNGSSSAVTPVYIVAVYDENGYMKNVYFPETTEATPAGESKTYSVTLTTPEEDVPYTIKGFMFKSLDTLVPFKKN